MLPTVDVDGVGAIVEAVPPVATVYHLREAPELAVAVSGMAMEFWQYEIGVVTVGVEREELTVTATELLFEEQPLMVAVTL